MLIKAPNPIALVRVSRTTSFTRHHLSCPKHPYPMPNSTPNPEVCDATDAP